MARRRLMRFTVIEWARVPLVVAACWSGGAWAQTSHTEFVFSSAPTRVGAGARAAGIGSAFVAVADDATAASWNPAGLVQLERPELAVVGRGGYRTDDVGTLDQSNETRRSTTHVGTDDTSSLRVNYASAVVPFSVRDRNVVVSANYQEAIAFDSSISLDSKSEVLVPPQLEVQIHQSIEQRGHIDTFSPAVAVELVPALSVGAALNYWFDGAGASYAWARTNRQTSVVKIDAETTVDRSDELQTFEGVHAVNGTFGLLWRVCDQVSLAARGDTAFITPFRRTIEERLREPQVSVTSNLRMRIPTSIASGISLRPNDRFLATFDVTWTDWSAFRIWDDAGQEFFVTGEPVSAPTPSGSGSQPDRTVDDTWTVRLGAEWVEPVGRWFVTARAGASYEPDPATGKPADLFGGSVGLGVSTGSLSVDVAYQLRFGNDVRGTALLVNALNAPNGHYDVLQHAFYVSTVVYF